MSKQLKIPHIMLKSTLSDIEEKHKAIVRLEAVIIIYS